MMVEVHWVPGHKNVERYHRAAQAAKQAAETPNTRGCLELFAFLAQVRGVFTERKWNETRYWFISRSHSHGPIQRVRYNPALEVEELDEKAMDTAAKTAHRYFQLKSMHAVTGVYLLHIGRTDRDTC